MRKAPGGALFVWEIMGPCLVYHPNEGFAPHDGRCGDLCLCLKADIAGDKHRRSCLERRLNDCLSATFDRSHRWRLLILPIAEYVTETATVGRLVERRRSSRPTPGRTVIRVAGHPALLNSDSSVSTRSSGLTGPRFFTTRKRPPCACAMYMFMRTWCWPGTISAGPPGPSLMRA